MLLHDFGQYKVVVTTTNENNKDVRHYAVINTETDVAELDTTVLYNALEFVGRSLVAVPLLLKQIGDIDNPTPELLIAQQAIPEKLN